MDTFYHTIRMVHILAGAAALVSGLIAMLTVKGGNGHRLNGKIYFWSMAVIFATSLYMSIFKSMLFFVLIAFFSFQAAFNGYRILYLKKLPQGQKPGMIDYVALLIGAIAAIGMLSFAVLVMSGNSQMAIILAVFGAFYSLGVWNEYRKFTKPPQEKMFWLYKHIGQMGGAYIATTTAFLVNNYRFFPFAPAAALWLAPTAVGIVLITFTVKKYRKKHTARS